MPRPVASGGAHADPTALVVAAHGSRGTLDVAGRRHDFHVRGRRLRVVCGDRVVAGRPAGSQSLVVTAVLPRSNVLARQPRRGSRPEVLAANVSRLVVVCAARPSPDFGLLDRYLCAAELMHCQPLVLWNKSDLQAPPETLVSECRQLGYPLASVSARTGAGLGALAALLRDHTSVFVGQSGAGKSSLVNVLVPAAAAGTGELSGRSGTGTHTTTAVLMYRLAAGGWLVDAPGVRDFLPALPAQASLAAGFVDIRERAHGCRFADCRHIEEPGCAVTAALAAGTLARRRYESYRALLLAAAAGTHGGR